MALPISLGGGYYQTQGPFIYSDAVYIVGFSSGVCTIYKCSDPDTGSFSSAGAWTLSSYTGDTGEHIYVSQYGQYLDTFVYSASTSAATLWHRTFDMSTDSWMSTGNYAESTYVAATSFSSSYLLSNGSTLLANVVGHRRSDGDVIAATTVAFVTNKGKDYSRIAARRLPSGSTTWGSATQIGYMSPLGTTSSTSEDIAGLLYDDINDRILVFSWTVDDASFRILRHRTVEASDNLDGQPSGSGNTTIVFASGLTGGALPDVGDFNGWDAIVWPMAFRTLFDGATYRIIYSAGSGPVTEAYATASATPSWTAAQTISATVGSTSEDSFHTAAYAEYQHRRALGYTDTPVAVWQYSGDDDFYYSTRDASPWATATNFHAGDTGDILYATSVFVREGNYKIAFIWYDSSGTTYYYDEEDLGSAGAPELPKNRQIRNIVIPNLSRPISGQLR